MSPVISSLTRTARKPHRCEGGSPTCSHTIKPGEQYQRLYGMAHRGETPYVIVNCLACWEYHRRAIK